MNYVILAVLVVVLIALPVMSARARRRQSSELREQADRLEVGSEVMTTSGLYGTVAARNDDDSVQLTIAPGIEVKWAMAALREVSTLPDQYRGGAGHDTPGEAGMPVAQDADDMP